MSSFRVAEDADRAAWDAFVAARPEADPLQAWAWGEANAVAGEPPVRALVTGADGTIRAVAQVLVRPAGFGRSVGYVPHGPVWVRDAPDATDLLGAMLAGAREVAAERRAIVVKVDPRADPAVGRHEALTDVILAHGLRPARHDLQARTTRLVELVEDEQALMTGWDKDARNLVRRSAREGVTTTTDRTGDASAIAAFHGLLVATAGRAGFRIRSREFLETLAHAASPSGGWFLTLARLEDRPIAGAIALRIGDRAIYAYGASLREEALKHAHGAYAALAATMRALAADGVRHFDLWGVVEPGDPDADASWAGFSAFKRQFGGEPLRHPGTFDLVISPGWYRVRDLRERLAGLRG
ncbi:MAG TPA: peptidoglycan bridge formation glycyltransferase FemA/FemB family protein [Clostridia bacterium]|nr:peptidoglycan bridge formation glycyltransferase FemA/FemB family protein [Clostridia bacterium]